MKVIAIMPIKLHNERCPGKNIRRLGGVPLLQHELESLKATGLVERIIVYCSDEAVISYLPVGVEFERRPPYLDLPTSNFTQIFEEFASSHPADVYVYAHATAPFVSVDTMRECIQAVTSGEYDSAFCAEKLQDYLWQNGRPLNFDPENLPRTQDLDPIFKETSGVYVFTREVFERHRRRVGVCPFIKEVTFREAVDIDTEEDFALAEALCNVEV